MRCNNNFNPLYWAVIAALFTVVGDVIALILAISELQQQESETQKQKDDLQQQIKLLQGQLNNICSE
jgi:sensor domain CHASE-containing protein